MQVGVEDRVMKAKKEIEAGTSIVKACRKNGTTPDTYRKFLKVGKKAKKNSLTVLPESLPSTMAMVIGTPSQIAEMARSFQ